MNRARGLVIGALLCVSVTMTVDARDGAGVAAVVDLAADYVARFVHDFSNVVAEERYIQTVDRRTGGPLQRRELRSEFLLVKPNGSSEWLQFRDVIDVDGQPVRGRSDRLVDLFVNAPADTLAAARRIWEESTRYNIGALGREANLPLVALCFLQDTYRDKFAFTLEKPDAKSGDTIVAYKETGRPTIIRGINDTEQPTHGRFWIEPRTGAVHRSELKYEGPSAFTTITTTFASDASFAVLVPSEMIEDHSSPRTGRIGGRATYAKFRRFGVSTAETIR